ncbi:MAG: hypothetical protein DDT26_00237 [Dehalococcoidia bacterium]|nr:hypothetical protein [Chloroflexota bacterium]
MGSFAVVVNGERIETTAVLDGDDLFLDTDTWTIAMRQTAALALAIAQLQERTRALIKLDFADDGASWVAPVEAELSPEEIVLQAGRHQITISRDRWLGLLSDLELLLES